MAAYTITLRTEVLDGGLTLGVRPIKQNVKISGIEVYPSAHAPLAKRGTPYHLRYSNYYELHPWWTRLPVWLHVALLLAVAVAAAAGLYIVFPACRGSTSEHHL